MNIAMINCGLVGSTGRIMLQLADCAKENGHNACIIVSGLPVNQTIKTEHPMLVIGNEITRKINVLLGRITGFTNCFAYFETKKMLSKLDKFKPDVIHLHNLHESYINLPLLFSYIKKRNIKVVWTLHDCWPFTGHCAKFPNIVCDKWKTECSNCPQYKGYPKSYFDNSKYMYKLKKKILTDVDNMTIVTPSKWLAGLVEESFLNKYEIKVINNGIDLSVFKPTYSDFRKKYNIPEDKFIVLGVKFAWGIINGFDIFVQLPKLLSDKFQVVMVGVTDENISELPEEIIGIKRTNSAEELAEIYTAADLFINPARDDNYPTVNMESIACGTPIITFDIGGCPETVFSGCGSVVPMDINCLAEEIKRIEKERPYKKEDCLEKSKSTNKEVHYNKYIGLFEDIIGN